MKVIWLTLALCLSLPVLAQQVANTRHVATTEGKEVRVYTYARTRSDCRPDTPPPVTVSVAPLHGSTSIRPGNVVARDFRDHDCTGSNFPGTGIWYTPAPGFHGSDQFEVAADMGRRIQHDTMIVDVQ